MNRIIIILLMIIVILLSFLTYRTICPPVDYDRIDKESYTKSGALPTQRVVWYKLATPVKNNGESILEFKTADGLTYTESIPPGRVSVLTTVLQRDTVLYSLNTNNFIISGVAGNSNSITLNP